MAQINLLKQKTASQNFWDILPGIVSKIMILVFLAIVGYYVWLYLEQKKVDTNIVSTQTLIAQQNSTLGNVLGRDELLVRQSQLAELKKLVDAHKYWSQILPVLAKVTLKSAKFQSLTFAPDGNLNLTVKVPDLIALDKFLLAFDKKSVYENFSYLTIGGVRQEKETNTTAPSVSVDVKMKFNTSKLNYEKPKE